MGINLEELNLDTIPDRAEGQDRITAVIVFDRPDPVGVDPIIGEELGELLQDYVTAVCAALGSDPADVRLRSLIENAELENIASSIDGFPAPPA